jgi:2-polyprenyl-3-methyl-5-hydroxy-6-metoxy-1,4-benzoquinol methylase
VPGRFLVADLESPLPPFPEAPFDTIVMAAVLEHLRHPEAIFRPLASLISPGGKFILTTPTSFGGKLHRLGSLVGLTYREAAEEHHRFLDEPWLRQMVMQAGFRRILYRRFLLNLNQFLMAEKV